ncbi:S1 family peptidase [Oscillatoria acuminata]|nr:serine protease [Oscillatoria acuminata]
MLLVPGVNPAIATSPREIAQTARQITVKIGMSQSSGTGVIVARNGSTTWVLTCGNVVDSFNGNYQIQTVNGQQYQGNTSQIQQIPQVNLALVPFFTNNSYASAVIGNSDQLAQGDPVYVGGFPGANHPGNLQLSEFQFTNGIISSRINPPHVQGYGLTHTSLTNRGMNGSPMFNPEGQLVAIHCGEDLTAQNSDQSTHWKTAIPINIFTNITQSMGLNINVYNATSSPSPSQSPPSTGNSFPPAQSPEPPPSNGRVW